MTVITRFPPSPTGFFHIGSARTALFNHLFAARNGGAMYLRFEDTDKARSKKEFEDDIRSGLDWLKIPYKQQDVFRQSEKTAVYRAELKRLIAAGRAYEAEAATDDPAKHVIRFKNPNVVIEFNDLIRGPVSFDTTELKDFVIAKNIDEPLYHLTVVIDDHDSGVTHVIRGEDHISNTPRQILILEALGFNRPQYAHMPLILAPDRSKLSKRHGAVSVNEYRAEGFLPEAIINYLALLGWNPGDDAEVFTLSELEAAFDIAQVQKGGAIFDIEKLRWFNHEHLKRLSDSEYALRYTQFSGANPDQRLVPLMRERAKTLKEAAALVQSGEFAFLGDDITAGSTLLTQHGKIQQADARRHLEKAALLLETIPEDTFTATAVRDAVFPYATEEGRGAVLWPLRVSLSGAEKSPDPFLIASMIGRTRTLSRIASAIQQLSGV